MNTKTATLGVRWEVDHGFDLHGDNLSIALERGAVVRFDAGADGAELRAGDGPLWVTRDGDATDYVVRPGRILRVCGPGRVVVEALEDATVRIGGAHGVAEGHICAA